ncbi:cupredoxin domain-containing protein [Corynebacterium tapiri]|uniref:Copper oxidase n=1 Tax=Corynebacterium tapiri TaxID=1448266 RepID=A0A5C4U153_9CORY|nr:cupredoxin domain-containing protein [Corynebacterium tapiri]TNL94643.1 copper oxidase [Corynebacterium tapiri]
MKTSWHRRLSRPVTLWICALVVAGLVHPALPNYRWVLIHTFTLGVLTNSILVWSQHFTEKFLHTRLDESRRPAQLLRSRLLNAGIILTLVGQLLIDAPLPPIIRNTLVVAGPAAIAVACTWHAVVIMGQAWAARRQSPRHAPAVASYAVASLALPFGAVVGSLMALGVSAETHSHLRQAHVIINVFGFVGLTAAATLTVLFPAIWRTRSAGSGEAWALGLLTLGVIASGAGAVAGVHAIVVSGLVLILAGWAWLCVGWLTAVSEVLRDPRDRISYSALSVLAATIWLLGTLAFVTGHAAAGTSVPIPTIALVVGFAAQLLVGVMCYLLPTTMRGGPGAVRAGMQFTQKGGVFRSTLTNLGLLIWLAAESSWLRVLASLLAIGALLAFVPLTARGARAQLAVIRKQSPAPQPRESHSGWQQLSLALALVALVVACFGGLGGAPRSTPSTTASSAPSTGQTTTIAVTMEHMAFSPNELVVPRGNSLVIELTNASDMDHDLIIEGRAHSGRLAPGQSARIEVGPVAEPLEGWCTIAGHRTQGMTLSVVPA